MKKALSAIIFILMVSCVPKPIVIPEYNKTVVIDFSNYSSKNFLFTGSDYDGAYESIGFLQHTFLPKAEYKSITYKNPNYKASNKNIDDDAYGSVNDNEYNSTITWIEDPIEYDKILETVYNKCISLGANGFVHFKAERITDIHYYKEIPSATIAGVRITGFAIKRK